MFDLDRWQEIGATLRMNKLRTALTASGVFWGMFMLVLMLGFGDGLERGVRGNMGRLATNAVYIWGQRTEMAYDGLRAGRSIDYDNADIPALRQIPEIQHLAPRNQLGGYRGGANVSNGIKTGNYSVSGDVPAFAFIQPMNFVAGRFINQLDVEQRRKVAVIGSQVRDELYGKDAEVIGEYIKVRGVWFQIVGVFTPTASGDDGDRQSRALHVPFTTFQQAFNTGDSVGWFAVTGWPEVDGSDLEDEIRAVLSRRHRIHPDDRGAIGSFNAEEEFGRITNLFRGIRGLVWFVGIATLASGVVGVSNIMLIVVRERTREFGLRRAIGATPGSIVALVVQESVALTAVSGYAGLVCGVGLLELTALAVGPENPVLGAPTLDLGPVLFASVVLIIAGAMAGVLPARAASRVRPVEALRAE